MTGVNNNNNSYVPLRLTKITNARKNVDLLLVNNGDNWHYVVIKNMSRLLSSQYKNHGHKTHFL